MEDCEEVDGNNDNDCQAGQPENTSDQRKRDEPNHQQNVAKGENTTCYFFIKAETNYFKMSLRALATSTAWKERLNLVTSNGNDQGSKHQFPPTNTFCGSHMDLHMSASTVN